MSSRENEADLFCTRCSNYPLWNSEKLRNVLTETGAFLTDTTLRAGFGIQILNAAPDTEQLLRPYNHIVHSPPYIVSSPFIYNGVHLPVLSMNISLSSLDRMASFYSTEVRF